MHLLRLFFTAWFVLGTVTLFSLFWLCKRSAARVDATVKNPLPDISAVTRYDLRKTYEEAEANAIGTEYVRAGLLSEADAAPVRVQLTKYLALRISFYQTRDEQELRQINADTAQLQTEMWSAVQAVAAARPTPVTALAVAGMNDVLNSQDTPRPHGGTVSRPQHGVYW